MINEKLLISFLVRNINGSYLSLIINFSCIDKKKKICFENLTLIKECATHHSLIGPWQHSKIVFSPIKKISSTKIQWVSNTQTHLSSMFMKINCKKEIEEAIYITPTNRFLLINFHKIYRINNRFLLSKNYNI